MLLYWLHSLCCLVQTPHHHDGSSATAAAPTDKQKRQEYEALRCRAIQWAYLDIMTQKLFKQQEEQAKVELHDMYSSLVKKMEENAELQRSIDRIEHQMAVDSALHAQVGWIVHNSHTISLLLCYAMELIPNHRSVILAYHIS